MASRAAATAETVGQALRDLALSRNDQEVLSEFLTDYFTSDDHELIPVHVNIKRYAMNKLW